MKAATYASARTANAVSKSLNEGLRIAFRSGAVMGLVVVGLGMLDVSLWYLILNAFIDIDGPQKLIVVTTTMLTFGMGASTQALFARVGGGIYTKAADVGADLVGKVEAGIPEDDPRNPTAIAENMVLEVRRQFRADPGILAGTSHPDYERCVSISTKGAQKEMIFPSSLAIVIPIIVGIIFGVAGVVGLLVGGLSTSIVLAIFMGNAGGAWDNAKKYIEGGNFGGKGSEAHKASIVGDTVGDPFKDTTGPSLDILIKLMSMVSIVVAGLVVSFSIF